MWPLKSQNPENTKAITEVMGKDCIKDFDVSWYNWDRINPWHGKIRWIKWGGEYRQSFSSPTFEETVKKMVEFTEKTLILEIK